jgi:hypothetical protein
MPCRTVADWDLVVHLPLCLVSRFQMTGLLASKEYQADLRTQCVDWEGLHLTWKLMIKQVSAVVEAAVEHRKVVPVQD